MDNIVTVESLTLPGHGLEHRRVGMGDFLILALGGGGIEAGL